MINPDLCIKVRVLTENEGGRKTPFINGYRGQFYYNESDWDATYEIIGKSDAKPGEVVELELQTASREIHFGKFEIGTEIKIREGGRVVAEGQVSNILNQKFEIWDLEKFQMTTAKSIKPYYGDNILDFRYDFDYYLDNEDLFDGLEIIESDNSKQILTIKMKKKETAVATVYQFIVKEWNENLKLREDRLRIDYDLDESNKLKKMVMQFATWTSIYMTGVIIVE
jgi:hypothetical protein